MSIVSLTEGVKRNRTDSINYALNDIIIGVSTVEVINDAYIN